jgi:oligosaccharide repeat unit polymerase
VKYLNKGTLLRWRRRSNTSDAGLPRVGAIQWILAGSCVVAAVADYEVRSYAQIALFAQAMVFISFILLASVTHEVFKNRCIGKLCLVAGTFVFYWIDVLTLTEQRYPFPIPEGFPITGTQFNQDLIHDALLYVALFQLLLLVGYSIRPRLERPLRFFAGRADSLSFDRTLIAFVLILCAFVPMLVYYEFDLDRAMAALWASRSTTEFESPDPGLAQHLALFGIYGAALFFVYALKVKTWRRMGWVVLGVLATLPFISGGARHVWLYISLPSLLIVLRGFKGSFTPSRVFALIAAAVFILLVAQIQIAYRAVGWSEVGNGANEELLNLNTNGHFTALLFAEYLVPNQHPYFKQPAEFYFVIHWIPRQLWPNKPIMESWTYYNDSYVQGANYNVTPSVIGQFHMDWGLPGVVFIGFWLGFLTMVADRLLVMLDSNRQRAMFVVAGMFYAFIISSFRFYSPIYFAYFVFGVIAMFLLTRRRRLFEPFPPISDHLPAQA